MFYSQIILAKKGPLGKIWLAAHWDKKLSKAQVFQTSIDDSVDMLVNPTVPLALRVSGHLLLGLVRIYQRKVKYLFTDCSEALVKIKMAFRPGVVDLPVSGEKGKGGTTYAAAISVAAVGEFELDDGLDDFDGVEPVLDDWMQMSAMHGANVSRQADITLETTPQSKITLGGDDAQSETWTEFNEDDEPSYQSGADVFDMDDTDQSVEVARDASVGRNSIAALNESMRSKASNAMGKGNEEGVKAVLEQVKENQRDSLANIGSPGADALDQADVEMSFDQPEIPDFDEPESSRIDEKQRGETIGDESEKENASAENSIGEKQNITVAIEEVKQKAKPARKKRKRKIMFKLDENTVLGNKTLRSNREDTSDILVTRLPFTYRLVELSDQEHLPENGFYSVKEKLQNPNSTDMHPALIKLYKRPMNLEKKKRRAEEEVEIAREEQMSKRRSIAEQPKDSVPKGDGESSASAHLEEEPDKFSGRDSMGASFGAGAADSQTDMSLNVTLDDPDVPEFEDDLPEEELQEAQAGHAIEGDNQVSDVEISEDEEDEEEQQQEKEERDMLILNLLGNEGKLLQVAEGKSRKTAAALFYKLLELKTKDQIDIKQEGPYEEISYRFLQEA